MAMLTLVKMMAGLLKAVLIALDLVEDLGSGSSALVWMGLSRYFAILDFINLIFCVDLGFKGGPYFLYIARP